MISGILMADWQSPKVISCAFRGNARRVDRGKRVIIYISSRRTPTVLLLLNSENRPSTAWPRGRLDLRAEGARQTRSARRVPILRNNFSPHISILTRVGSICQFLTRTTLSVKKLPGIYNTTRGRVYIRT